MCGILGIVGTEEVGNRLYDGLTLLQHRGQDAAGIATSFDGRLVLRRNSGLVRDVFRAEDMARLGGGMGIGHVRYPTAGTSGTAESQPFYVNCFATAPFPECGGGTNGVECIGSQIGRAHV